LPPRRPQIGQGAERTSTTDTTNEQRINEKVTSGKEKRVRGTHRVGVQKIPGRHLRVPTVHTGERVAARTRGRHNVKKKRMMGKNYLKRTWTECRPGRRRNSLSKKANSPQLGQSGFRATPRLTEKCEKKEKTKFVTKIRGGKKRDPLT